VKILVAIPVYDGKLMIEVVRCLLNEQAVAHGNGDELSIRFLSSCSHPAMGRNQLAQEFMDSDADRLVYLDADVTFEPASLVRIAHHPFDFVGGAYRFKQDHELYPVGWMPGDQIPMNRAGLCLVSTLPGGFLSLSRNVFETLKNKFPERAYTHFGKVAHAYFSMPFKDGYLCGEDSNFCMEWADAGGQVWLDPELSLTHWDFNKPYPGHIGNWLKARAGVAQIGATA
jgi:hypothetical protein